MNCLFWHFAGPLEVDDISSQFIFVFVISYCHVCLHTLLVVPWMHHVCLTCCANPADVALFSLRHSEWKVNVCVSLSCDPVYIDVSLKVALPAASLCSAVTVLQYPVALKTLYLFRIMFRIGKWSRPRLQRDGRLLHVFIANFIRWIGLNLIRNMHNFSRLYLDCIGCRDGGVWR